MTAIETKRRAGGSEKLTDEGLHQVDLAARRLHAELRAYLDSLDAADRSASALARLLGIDRTTCQRAGSAVAPAYPGPSLVARVPGVKALRQLADAAAAGPGAADLGPLHAAIDHFESTIARLGGSQSALIRRIEATADGAAAQRHAPDADTARERLFDAAAQLTGRWSNAWVAVYAYWSSPASPDRRLALARVNGLLGHVARPDAVPLTFHTFSSPAPPDGGDADAPRPPRPLVGDGASPIIPGFTTAPPPVVSSKHPGEFIVQAIDAEPAAPGRPIDLMLGSIGEIPHPAAQQPAMEEAWAMVNFPVRRLLFDIHLHRDLARACIPSLDAHLWRPDFAQHVGDRWQTRFADGPTLELLGQGLRNIDAPANPRHRELTGFLFDAAGQDPADFVGFRCAVEHPMWRTGYCVSFDFSDDGAAGAA